jgi:hypothetical protein
MKKQSAMALMLLSLLLALVVTPIAAQSTSHFVRLRIPFEFMIGDKTFSPGEYIVKRSVSDRPETLSIRSVNGESGEYVLTSNVKGRTRMSKSMLVFHHYGERYFLSQVWTAGDSEGRELLKSVRERELAKNTVTTRTRTLIASH